MKSKSSSAAYLAAFVIASGTITQATSITVDAVGVINPQNRTISEATGNSVTASTFATDIATAFSNNTGGVWDLEAAAGYSVSEGETVTVNFGSNSLVLTLSASGGGTIDNNTIDGNATSGSRVFGFGGNTNPRTFTPSEPLLTVGAFSVNRNDASRLPVLTVTFLDTTTASTSGANAGATFFHSISGTMVNPIVSFTLSQNNFVRWDDIGFVTASAIPEPASAATLVGLAAVGFVALRRRRARS